MRGAWFAWARRWQPAAHLVRWTRCYRDARLGGHDRLQALAVGWRVAAIYYGCTFHS